MDSRPPPAGGWGLETVLILLIGGSFQTVSKCVTLKVMRKEVAITGVVIRGAGYGQKLGFPTANLDRLGYSRRKRKPRIGVYAGTACIVTGQKSEVKSCRYPAAIVIGPRDDKGHPKIEAHLIGFHDVLYGKRLQLSFIKYLRPFRVFKSEAALRKQIRDDLNATRKLFPRNKEGTF